MIYLYAITEPVIVVPPLRGLEDEPLALLSAGEVAGVYSAHRRMELHARPEALWRHDQVVEDLMGVGPTLPVRFGTTFPDEAGLSVALEREQAKLRRRLEQVRGCVELAVRVGLPESASDRSDPRDGSDYVQAKLRERRERASVAARTLQPLAELAVSSREETERAQSHTLTASYLVRENEVERFAEAVKVLQRDNGELALSCTGPWPPYSFVEEAA